MTLSPGSRFGSFEILGLLGAVFGYGLAWAASTYLETVRMPGALPAVVAATVLVAAALVASLIPAARASRVDVLQALRSE